MQAAEALWPGICAFSAFGRWKFCRCNPLQHETGRLAAEQKSLRTVSLLLLADSTDGWIEGICLHRQA